MVQRKKKFQPTESVFCEEEEKDYHSEHDHVSEPSKEEPKKPSPTQKEIASKIKGILHRVPNTTLQDLRRKHNNLADVSPKYRTAMGEYIVPPGGRPLTRQGVDEAGPAEYFLPSPNMTKLKNPEWSILQRNFFNPKGPKRPPPNAYTIPTTVEIKNKKFIMHGRLKANKKVIAGPCKVGPAYKVDNYSVGKEAKKFSFPKANRDKVITGPPNALVQPEDVPGFRTPGAVLYDDSVTLPHSYHTFFTNVAKDLKGQDFPGPGTYELPAGDTGLQKSFGIPLYKAVGTDVPAPNVYDIGTTIGDAPAYSITLPNKEKQPFRVPSPGAYMVEREYDHKEKIHFAYRYPSPEPENKPDPCTYKLKRDLDIPKPCPAIKSRVKIPFPCSAFGFDAEMGRSPGPAAHDINRNITRRDKGISMARRRKDRPDENPGPADHGLLEVDPLSTKSRAPAYSMRPQYKEQKLGPNPGPAAYGAPPLDFGPAPTLKSRKKPVFRQLIPAPNAYIPIQGCTRQGLEGGLGGVSLRSRHSPHVFSPLKRDI